METTFQEQSELWLKHIENRKKSPAKVSSITQFKSHLRFINSHIGGLPLSNITNKTLREFIPKLEGRAPQTINCYVNVVKSVVKSCVGDDGEIIHTRTWNSDFMDLPSVSKQKTPMFSAEEIAEIVAKGNGAGLLYKLAASSGARIGELLALEPRHFNGRTLKIEQSLWGSIIQTPKTDNGVREIDLPLSVSVQLQKYVSKYAGRLFDFSYSDALLKLHAVLDELKIPRTGFHAFRRFRVTHLRKSNVREDLLRFWIGHADKSITDRYSKLWHDTEFRLAEAERIGSGFNDRTSFFDEDRLISRLGK